MLIGSRQRLSTLSENLFLETNGIPLDQVPQQSHLVSLLDENLTWGSHIDQMTKRIASGIGAVKRLRSFVSFETLHVIYQAPIQPHFDYCNVVWGLGKLRHYFI